MGKPRRPGNNRLGTRARRLRRILPLMALQMTGMTPDRHPCRPLLHPLHQLTTTLEAGRRKVPRSRLRVTLTTPQNVPGLVIRSTMHHRLGQRDLGGKTQTTDATTDRCRQACPGHRPAAATQTGTDTTDRLCVRGALLATTTGPDSTATRSLPRGSQRRECRSLPRLRLRQWACTRRRRTRNA